jgi:hypothetical protein
MAANDGNDSDGDSGKEDATIDLSHQSQKGADGKGVETKVIKGETR